MIFTKNNFLPNNSALLLVGCSVLFGTSIKAQDAPAIPLQSGVNYEQLIPADNLLSSEAMAHIMPLQKLPQEEVTIVKAKGKKRSSIGYNATTPIANDIIIPSGSEVIVYSQGHLLMAPGTKIDVRPGGRLIVNGGKITGSNGQSWHGINVHGPNSLPQHQSTHGYVRLKNGARIEDARFALRNYKQGVGGQNGGIIEASDSYIINSHIGAHLSQYNYSSGGTRPDNISYFERCHFEVNDQGIWKNDHFWGILSWDVKGLDLRECTFIDSRSTVPSVDDMGTALYTYAGSFNMSLGNQITNMKEGVVMESSNNQGLASDLDYTTFTNVHRAVKNKECDGLSMTSCNIQVGTHFGFPLAFNEAIYSEGADDVYMKENYVAGPTNLGTAFYSAFHFNGSEYVTNISLISNITYNTSVGVSAHRISGKIVNSNISTTAAFYGINASGSKDLSIDNNYLINNNPTTNAYTCGIEYYGSPSDDGMAFRCNTVDGFARGISISSPNFDASTYFGNSTHNYNKGLVLNNLQSATYVLGAVDKFGHDFYPPTGAPYFDMEINGAGVLGVGNTQFTCYSSSSQMPSIISNNGCTIHMHATTLPFTSIYCPNYSSSAPQEITSSETSIAPSMKMYPNPASSNVMFEAAVEGTLEVFSMAGQLLHSENVTTGGTININVEQYVDGLYLCRFTSVAGTHTSKLKIQH